ncbi:MAG TPA: hypothetical protein VEU72_08695 [Nitrosopumilaceae archaeon]|nr:hypothetical protein [Nitrosopumilaceae archaeon]
MNNYVRFGWAFLSVGGFILFIFLVNDLPNACINPPQSSSHFPPDTKAPVERCWLIFAHFPEIIISIAMIITGIVLRSVGRKK